MFRRFEFDVSSKLNYDGKNVLAVQVISATLKNPSPNLAFLLQLAVTKGPGGREVGPCYWEDNYFSLLPGESRTVTAVVPKAELDAQSPTLRVLGWNVR